MGIFLDIIIIAILIINIIIGYKKGLINVIFNICAFLIAIIATLVLYKPISNIIINNTQIDNKIEEIIIKNNDNDSEKIEEKNNKDINTFIKNAIQNTAEEAKKQATEVVAKQISTKVVEVITGIILFIVIRAILFILKITTGSIAKFPIIKQLNEVGGIAYGAIKGLVIVYIILTIMFFIISIKGNEKISTAIEESYVTKVIYNNNIIVNYCVLGKHLV